MFFHPHLDKNRFIIRKEVVFLRSKYGEMEHLDVISKDYEQLLRQRKALFMESTGISRGVVHTFITPMGVANGAHSSLVHSQLTAEALFASLGKY